MPRGFVLGEVREMLGNWAWRKIKCLENKGIKQLSSFERPSQKRPQNRLAVGSR
jgi:hypothetical protein